MTAMATGDFLAGFGQVLAVLAIVGGLVGAWWLRDHPDAFRRRGDE